MNKTLIKTITGVIAASTVIGGLMITSNAAEVNNSNIRRIPAVVQEAEPQVIAAPSPVYNLVDTGIWYYLANPGQAANGTMVYSLDGANWSTSIPTAMQPGTYKIYFKVVSNDGRSSTGVNYIQTTIANPGPRDFVNLMYTKLLNRAADVNSLNNLTHDITFNGKTGADVVNTIISSAEFTNLNLSNEDFVERLYAALAGRYSDPTGKANWVNLLKNGSTRQEVAARFINAYEFSNICVTYGVTSGSTAAPTITKRASSSVRFFVNRLYTSCFGRNADENGMESWSSNLANLRMTGTQVAYNLIFSDDMNRANLNDTQFITVLYRALLGREPDAAGLTTWTNYLQSGATRQDLFNQFAATNEFGGICETCGVIR